MSFFKKTAVVAAITCIFAGFTVNADEEAEEIASRSRQMMEMAAKDIPSNLTSAEIDQDTIDEASKLMIGKEMPVLAGKGVIKPDLKKVSDTKAWDETAPALYVSLSIPKDLLKVLLKDAKERDYPIVFRGIMPDAKINSIAEELVRIAGSGEELPTVLLDSLAFKKHAITSVPAFVIPRTELNMRPIVYLGGSPSDNWIKDNIEIAAEDPIKSAETYPIAEPDFVEEMTRRFSKIDWEKKKQEAIDRFWSNQSKSFVRLPDATETTSYKFEPSIVVTQLVQAADGKVIARPGDVVNPLKALKLTQSYLFFNATKPEQREFVRDYMRSHPGKLIRLIATEVPVKDGWDIFAEMEQEYKMPVYLAPKVLVERMRLRAVPCVVKGEGNSLVVSEYKPG